MDCNLNPTPDLGRGSRRRAMAAPRTSDELLELIQKSELIDGPALETFLLEHGDSFAGVDALAGRLIQVGLLTAFQMGQLPPGQMEGVPPRQVQDPPAAGSGRHGTGVAWRAHADAPAGGDQAPAEHLRQRVVHSAVLPGGPRRRGDGAPEHRPRLRPRPRRGDPLPGHGVRGRPDAGRTGPPRRTAAVRAPPSMSARRRGACSTRTTWAGCIGTSSRTTCW